jgi:hypothetical protein
MKQQGWCPAVISCVVVAIAGCGSVSEPDAPCAATPANLVARWRADAMAPTDDQGNFLGVPMGHPGYAAGKHGSAFQLDGVADAFTVQDHEVLWPAASFSVEAWVLTTDPGATQTIVQKYDCHAECTRSTGQGHWQLKLENGQPQFDVRGDTGTEAIVQDASLAGVAAGAWHHLVGVRDSDAHEVRLYMDGVRRGAPQPDPGKLSNVDGADDPLTIGAAASFADTAPAYITFFAGEIDELAYYTTALDDAEVAAIYAAPQGECP